MNRLNYLTIRHNTLSKEIANWESIQGLYGERPDVKEMMSSAREELLSISLELEELSTEDFTDNSNELEECPACPMYLTNGGDRMVCLYCGFEDLPDKPLASIASEGLEQ